MKKLFTLIFISSLFVGSVNAQKLNMAKINLGIGNIAGINPSGITTLDLGFSAEFATNFFGGENFLLNYFYSRKFEYFIPESREGRVYPYLQGFSLEFLIVQKKNNFEFQEGLGPVIINDKIFSDDDFIIPGIMFTFNLLLPVRLDEEEHWGLGSAVNYAIGLGGDNPNYFSVDISLIYNF